MGVVTHQIQSLSEGGFIISLLEIIFLRKTPFCRNIGISQGITPYIYLCHEQALRYELIISDEK